MQDPLAAMGRRKREINSVSAIVNPIAQPCNEQVAAAWFAQPARACSLKEKLIQFGKDLQGTLREREACNNLILRRFESRLIR